MSTGQPSQPVKKSSTGLDENIASLLCYAGWWVTGVIFLIIEKDSKTVKFNAWQSIMTFAGISIIMFVLGMIPFIRFFSGLVWLAGAILWIFLMYKSFKGEKIKLPVVGDMAETQANK